MSTILEEDVLPNELNRETAALAFLERWKDPKEASKGDEGAKAPSKETKAEEKPEDLETDETPDTDEPEAPSEDTEDDGEEKTEEPVKVAKAAADDDEVTFTVDGVEQKATVKELKRLAGQEAALTRKSQDVANKTKEVDDLRVHHITALNAMVQRAEEAYRPFAEMDMLVASREMSPEDFAAVRAEAARTYNDYKFLTEELGGQVQKQSEASQKAHALAAADCIKALSDPTTGIPDYNQAMYNEMCTYAVNGGMKPEVVYTLTDPNAFKLIHKAMAYDKIKSVATQKKAAAPKTVLKSTSNTTTAAKTTTPNGVKEAEKKLKVSGSRNDAASLLLQRWKSAAD